MYIKGRIPASIKRLNASTWLSPYSPFTGYVPYSNLEAFNIVTQGNKLCSIVHYFKSEFVTMMKMGVPSKHFW